MAVNLNIALWPRQRYAFESFATEMLFGGATRGGKSFFIKASLSLWCLAIPGLQCFLYRKYYEDVLKNHMEGPDGFRALLAPLIKKKIVTCTKEQVRFANGSAINLEHCSTEEALEKAQGVPKHVLVLDEATQIPERRIRFLRGWVTMTEEMKDKLPEQLKGLYPDLTPAERRELFPRIIYTANAIGESMGFFRREFVKARPKGEIEKVGAFRRQYIESLVTDNPSENAEAVAGRLAEIGDEAEADALLNANWDAPVGEFLPQFSDQKHTCPDFRPPDYWFKFRTFDWGSSDPFCVLWWAVSDGESFEHNGEKRWFPRGALICYREWYGCHPKMGSKGLQLRNEEIAQGIRGRTVEQVSPLTLTDSLPFQDRGMTKHGKKYLISDVFADCGVPLTLANTARVYGWGQLKSRLIGKDGLPLIYFCESCKYVREYLPALPRHKTKSEDAAEDGEATHCADAVRYACATKPVVEDRPQSQQPVIWASSSRSLAPSDILKQMSKPKARKYVTRR